MMNLQPVKMKIVMLALNRKIKTFQTNLATFKIYHKLEESNPQISLEPQQLTPINLYTKKA